MFYKKAVLKTFTLTTGKHLRWSFFLIVLKVFKPATLLKKGSNTGAFLLLIPNISLRKWS